MATTIHLPGDLLTLVDHQAAENGVSRNRYIVRALEKVLKSETGWSRRFQAMLAEAREDSESHHTLDEMMRLVSARRSRKGPPVL